MSVPKDTQNVIGFQSRQAQATASARNRDAQQRIRDLALARIDKLVQTLFENVDDALFELAERSAGSSAQADYFDGMREVRKKRQFAESQFHDNAASAFAEFAEGRLKIARPELASNAGEGLSLVDESDLEEALAVSGMVAKAENRLTRMLYALNLRFAALIGKDAIEDASNPVGPAVLGDAFRKAIGAFDVNVQVKLIIYKLFDRYVMSGLEPVYVDINDALVAAGLLPQLRPTPHAGRAPAASGDAGAAPAVLPPAAPLHDGSGLDAANVDSVAGNGIAREIYNTLRSLLSRRHQEHVAGTFAEGASDASSASGPVPGTEMGLSPTDLLSALSILQSQTSHPGTPASQMESPPANVGEVKRALLAQVRKLSHDSREQRVSTADEDTIDLVGMLFEYVLEDRNLPAQIQVQLGRLQIPYLKVAFLDKHLFAQKAHPARRLLDALAEAGKGWSEESDRDHRLYDRIKTSVDNVLRDFDDDIGVFERETACFESFIEQHIKRSELAELRAAEATRGRERLDTARKRAAHEILQRIGDRELAPIVHTVLSRPWSNYLVLTLLRQGDDSQEWRKAVDFADDFVWSAQPKSDEPDFMRLREMLPQLEKSLRQGLATVAYHESDTRKLMQELSTFYRHVLDGEKMPSSRMSEVVAANLAPSADPKHGLATVAPSAVEEMIVAATEAVPVQDREPPLRAMPDAESLAQVRAMKVGTWIELIDADDQRERAKLSWVSPISARYLFVNRRGLKVCDKAIEELADLIATGRAVVLEEVPLFDRALDAIVARLRAANADAAQAPAAPAAS